MRPFYYVGIFTAAALLGACTVGPKYHRPVVQTPTDFHGSNESQHTAQTVDLQGAKTAHARVEMGAGQLNINGGANHMLDADFTYDGTFDAPRVDYHVDGGVGQLSISQNSHSTHFGRSQNDWNLHLLQEVHSQQQLHDQLQNIHCCQ